MNIEIYRSEGIWMSAYFNNIQKAILLCEKYKILIPLRYLWSWIKYKMLQYLHSKTSVVHFTQRGTVSVKQKERIHTNWITNKWRSTWYLSKVIQTHIYFYFLYPMGQYMYTILPINNAYTHSNRWLPHSLSFRVALKQMIRIKLVFPWK